MAHALAAFIAERMDQRGLRNRDLVSASGLSRALVSKYATDQRQTLNRLPAKETLDGLAKGLGVSPAFLLGKAIEALGIGYEAGDFVNGVETASDDELVDELRDRLERRLAGRGPIDRDIIVTAAWALEQREALPPALRQLRNHAAHSPAEALEEYLTSVEGAESLGGLIRALTQAVRPLPARGDLEQAEAYLAGDDAKLIALQTRSEEAAASRAAHEDDDPIEDEQGHPEDA